MTLTQLEYVVAIDTHRHFARAAEQCHVTQPTLSMQVQKLERGLGVEIFDRRKQPVEPTDLGRRLIEQARVILREAARLEEMIEEADREVAGELRVGIIPTLAPYLLPRFVPGLVAGYPELTLTIEELRTRDLLEEVQNDRLDCGVIATPAPGPEWVDVALFEEPFVGYVSEQEPFYGAEELRSDDLRLDELWLLHEGHCFRDQVVDLCGEQRVDRSARPVRFESNNLETLKRLVEASGGMTLLPGLATLGLTEQEKARVRRFREPAPYRIVRLVRGRGYLKRRAIAVLEMEIRRSVSAGPGGVRSVPGAATRPEAPRR